MPAYAESFFTKAPEGRFCVILQVIIIILGALPVYGTVAGFGGNSAFINVRDTGPMIAGLPGDPTACSCSLATNLAGLFGG